MMQARVGMAASMVLESVGKGNLWGKSGAGLAKARSGRRGLVQVVVA